MSEHTPGPWKVGQYRVDGDWAITKPLGNKTYGLVGYIKHKSNASLIAAAPDLLAASLPVIAAAMEADSCCLRDPRETWNRDAHVEITLTVAEIWAISDAIHKARTA